MQVVPHVTDAIQEWIERVAHIAVDGRDGPADVCVIELGGTVGDIESMPFIEALRQVRPHSPRVWRSLQCCSPSETGRAHGAQFQFKVGPGNFCCVHVSLVPVLGVVGEQKTKPTQHSVAVLRSLGLSPHLLACRSQEPLSDAVRAKLVSLPPRLRVLCEGSKAGALPDLGALRAGALLSGSNKPRAQHVRCVKHLARAAGAGGPGRARVSVQHPEAGRLRQYESDRRAAASCVLCRQSCSRLAPPDHALSRPGAQAGAPRSPSAGTGWPSA